MTRTDPVLEHPVPTVGAGSVLLTLGDGATLYELHVHAERDPVTVYLSHDQNRDLMTDVGAVLGALQSGSAYAASVRTMAGVVAAGDPAGLIRTVLDPAGSITFYLFADDGQGGEAGVVLDQAGAEALLMGTALMAGHL